MLAKYMLFFKIFDKHFYLQELPNKFENSKHLWVVSKVISRK